MKTLKLIYGPSGQQTITPVTLGDFEESEPLTPRMARRAVVREGLELRAIKVVSEREGRGYSFYSSKPGSYKSLIFEREMRWQRK